MEKEFQYFAFISYKHEDEKWAKWLQNKLESYKIPSVLRREFSKGLPQNIRPIFRDKTDISKTGKLESILQKELLNSKFLIVICSPKSARSEWVNQEVIFFQKKQRSDYIIPFIIKGTPNPTSDVNQQCYPPAIDKDILGISISELGKEKAFIRSVAVMLEINFDMLWNRHRERILKKRIRGIIAITITIILFSAIVMKQNFKITEQNNYILLQSANLKNTNDELNERNNELTQKNDIIEKKNAEIRITNTALQEQIKQVSQQRDIAQTSQSQNLAFMSREQLKKGDAFLAILLALKALPQNINKPDRPYVPEAEGALREAIFYLNLQGHKKLTTLGDNVNSAQYNSAGDKIVTASKDGIARIWNAKSGYRIAECIGHLGVINTVAFSPDGKKIITASNDYTARIWNVENGKVLHICTRHTGNVHSASFSPDNNLIITASADSTARIWNAVNGNLIAICQGHLGSVNTAIFSPDGKYIVTASDDSTVRIWNRYGKHLLTNTIHSNKVISAVFSSDSKMVATASADSTVCIWDFLKKKNTICKGHKGKINMVTFSPDCKLIATASDDCTARIWKINGKEEFCITNQYEKNAVAFSHNGKLLLTVSVHADVYDIETRKKIIDYLHGGRHAIFSPNDKEILTFQKEANIYDIEGKGGENIYSGDAKKINSISFSDSGNKILTIDDQNAYVWSYMTGKKQAICTGHTKDINTAVFTPNEQHIITASNDGTIRKWSIKDGKGEIISKYNSYVRAAIYTPNHKFFTIALIDGTIQLWDAESRHLIWSKAINGSLDFITFSPNSEQIFVALFNGNFILLNTVDGANIGTGIGHTEYIIDIAYSHDCHKIVTGSRDHTAKIWNAKTASLIATCTGHTDYISSVTFSKNGEKTITGSGDYTTKIWNTHTGKLITTCAKASNAIEKVTVCPEDDNILIASYDATLQIYNMKYQKTMFKYVLPSASITNAFLVPKKHKIGWVEAWKDNFYLIDYPSFQELVEQAKKNIGERKLTQEEQIRFHLK